MQALINELQFWDVAANQALLASNQARLWALQRSRPQAQQRPQQTQPSPVEQGRPRFSCYPAGSRLLVAIRPDAIDNEHRHLQAERLRALPRQSDILEEDVIQGFM